MVQGSGKADWQEVFSDGTDPSAQAGTKEEVQNKKNLVGEVLPEKQGSI